MPKLLKLTVCVLFWAIALGAIAMPDRKAAKQAGPTYDPDLLKGLAYRSIGPFRGGRSAAVTGVPGKPTTFFFGATGGGVWSTSDGGSNWKSLSDGFFGGSIGAVAVSEWDPNVIYVGGGEKTVRGNVSPGSGMWKSMDMGKTWTSIGLEDSQHIPRVRIHPKNPDLVYAAVLGHLFGPNPQRGVFRSKDGGKTWERVLFVNEDAGAVDLLLDPTNPRILYATTWRVRRTPYSLESGGEGSALWKSTDGGDTWVNLSDKKGFPSGTLGIIGVAVAPANPNRVWAIVEAEKGGVYRSEDGGESWSKINDERKLRQRAWYYTRIYADPVDADTVYVLNVQFWRSKDGGKSYQSIRTPHGDHHDLWIAPEDPLRMIVGDDGGAQISYDGGESWSTYHNQPTAQFYRVTTDNAFPYRIYGAQQDNSTVRIQHRTTGSAIGERDWEPTAGGESGHIAPHPTNPDIVYGGSYGGFLIRYDHRSEEARSVHVWPDNPMGHGAADLKYRFQWNFPIFFSPHDTGTLYTAANVLFKTTDEGQSWTAISPDLTRNDKSKQGPSGGPITKDNTSVEYYCTIFAALESPHEPGVLWTGSDDGLVQVTRDGGANWQNVTPPDLPEWAQINSVEADPFNAGGLYFAATRYKSDDFRPYLYKTEDYGRSWRKLVAGIDEHHFTRVLRADPKRRGLLYAGTEAGMYISFDDGKSWQPFQLNLPIVPITDLALKDDDLIVATQGRSFWVLDDLTALHQLKPQNTDARFHLFQPRATWRMAGRSTDNPGNRGKNPPNGVIVRYFLKEKPAAPKAIAAVTQNKDQQSGISPGPAPSPESPQSVPPEGPHPGKDKAQAEPKVTLEFLDSKGVVIQSFNSQAEEKKDLLEPEAGINQFVWNLQYADAETFPEMILWSGGTDGPTAPPGGYQVRLKVGDEEQIADFQLIEDPRTSAPVEDLRAQFEFLIEIRDKLSETHSAIKRIRKIRDQIDYTIKPMKGKDEYQDVRDAAKSIQETLTQIEDTLYQTKNRSNQDPLNFPIRLNDKLSGVAGLAAVGSYRPTKSSILVRDELVAAIDAQLKALDTLVAEEIPKFNTLVSGKRVPAIWIEDEKKPETRDATTEGSTKRDGP